MKKLIMTALVLPALFVSAFSRAAWADAGLTLQDNAEPVTAAAYREATGAQYEQEIVIHIDSEPEEEETLAESEVEILDEAETEDDQYDASLTSKTATNAISNTSLSWDDEHNYLLFSFKINYEQDHKEIDQWNVNASGKTIISGTINGTTVNYSTDTSKNLGKVTSFTNHGNYSFSVTVSISGSNLETFFKASKITGLVWYDADEEEVNYYRNVTLSSISGYTDAYNSYKGHYLGYKYTLVLDANMDTGEKLTESLECVVGDEVTLSDDIFARAGYTLSGWDTKSDGSGTRYAAGATVSGLSTTNGATVTLYAQWEAPAAAPVTIYSEAAGNMASYTDEHSVRVEVYDEQDSLVETYEGDELPFGGSLVLRHGDSVTLPEITAGYTVKLLVDDVNGYHTSQKVWSTGGRENGDEGADTDSETGAVVSGDGLEFLLTHTKQMDVDTGIYDINEKLGLAMMLFSAVGILLIVGLGAGLRSGHRGGD